MKTPIEVSLELEDKIREESKTRFPNLDPDLVVKSWFDKTHRNSRGLADALFSTIFQSPKTQEDVDAASEKN